MLVAKGRPAQLRIEVRDYDGIYTTPDGDVEVVTADIDGLVVETGTATGSEEDEGIYTYNFTTAVTGNIGVYEATITYTLNAGEVTKTVQVETVAEYLFEVHEVRERNSQLTETSYPAQKIREARDTVTQAMEKAAEIAFATRAARAILSGDGSSTILLPHVEVTAITGVTIYGDVLGTDTGDELTGTDLADVEVDRATGLVTRTDGGAFPLGSNNVVIDYEHGYEHTPGPIREAAMTVAIEYLVPSAIPARATSVSTDIGDFRISVANLEMGRDTGIPAVDTAIAAWGRKRPRVG